MDVGDLRKALDQDATQIVYSDELCLAVASVTETTARWIAQNLSERTQLVDTFSQDGSQADIWSRLGAIWKSIALSFAPAVSSSTSSEDSRIYLALALAKFERNLLAGLREHQDEASAHESEIRLLLFDLTTFTRIEDPRFYTLHAVLTQLLSNMISPTSPDPEDARIADRQMALYLSGRREDDVIIRLLDALDPKTNLATLHLIHNTTRGSPERLQLLLSEAGLRWVSRILARMDLYLEAHDGRFELCHEIISQFISNSLHPQLLNSLSIPNEPISPSQTTLLKILDAYLSSSHPNTSCPPSSPHSFLVPMFHLLAGYASTSMANVPDDARLPKVFEGLVLVCEGLSSIGLAVQARTDDGVVGDGGEEELVRTMKDNDDTIGVVKPLIEMLRQLDSFLPRVKPGASSSSSSSPLAESPDTAPLAGLKRNLVQLVGILSFNDTAVGDLVREYGGVQLILSMTEIDESNPYLREHALFATRNLMHNNPANQALIAQMDPIGVVADTGEVLPLPEKMRRHGQDAHIADI
ncbi:spinocerebellar ataxia type 10 protein domain-domain-containing protein [Naematelia encephala]|uniref:Ataxin-10 homolog n=1 Tax=Naematelia encephala TaxID=71784 RepID=A0A1Y2BLK2_9TREE|nr:spinocerebellar ataxia type 10 protein domain-domain-containing protein [Naematelia encephala]